MILDKATLKRGKTHCGRGLITFCYERGCGSVIKISRLTRNPFLTFKYWCQLSSAVNDEYSYSFALHRYLIKKSDTCNTDKLLSTEATFGFCYLY